MSCQDTDAASAPSPSGTPAAATRISVFWRPIARPAWAPPEISAAAVNERPFQLMAKMPPAISTGTSSAEDAPASAAALSSSSPATRARRRNGSMRASRWSDQRPTAMRAPAPPSCTSPSATAALVADQSRSLNR